MLSSLLLCSHSLFPLKRQYWTTVVGVLYSLLLGYIVTLYSHSRDRTELLSWEHFMLPFCMYAISITGPGITAPRLHSCFLLSHKKQDWTTVVGLLCALLLGYTVTLYSHSRGRTELMSWEHFMLPFCMYLSPLPSQESLLLGCTVILYSHSRGRTELLPWDHFMLPFCMYAISITGLEETNCSHILCIK